MTGSIALVTCAQFAEGEDAQLLGPALGARDVAAGGIPVVPTEWVDPGEPVDLPAGEYVVKPSVGADSRGVGRFRPGAHGAARTHAAALHDAGRAVRVQPYLADVDTAGPVVRELELIEPSLFFPYDQHAAACFAAAVSRRL